VRWISTTGFEENLRGAYGGGEGTNGIEGLARQGGGRTIGREVRMAVEGGVHWCKGGTHGREGARMGKGGRDRAIGGTHDCGGRVHMADKGHARQGGACTGMGRCTNG
jgi:hypothetical protein